MKYIPGFKFSVKTAPGRKPGITTIKDLNKPKPVNTIPELQANTDYIIYNVIPDFEKGVVSGITYVFKHKGGKVKVKFNSIAEADQKIDRILGVVPPQADAAADARSQVKEKLSKDADRYFNRR